MKKLPSMRLLICDTAENAAEALLAALTKYKVAATAWRAGGKTELFAALRSQDWDVLLLNEKVDEVEVKECAACIREHKSNIAIVVLTTRRIGIEELCQCYRQGAAALVSLDSPEYSVTVIGREFVNVQNRRRQLELARENAELSERCQLLLRSSREAIAYVHGGMHVYANESYRKLYGFADVDELLGTPFIDTVAEDCKESLRGRLKAVGESPGGRNGGQDGVKPLEVRARRGDGTAFPARLAISPTMFDGEKCLQVIVGVKEEAVSAAPAVEPAPAALQPAAPKAVSAPAPAAAPAPELTLAPEAPAAAEKAPETPAANVRPISEGAAVIPLEPERKAEAGLAKEVVGRLIAERSGDIHYQPVIAVSDMEPEFYAMELRLKESGASIHAPEDYIEAVNRNPLGQKLDQWALEEAMATLVRHDKQGERLQFIINLSAQGLADRKFPESFAGLMAIHGLDPQALVLNLRQPDVVANLEQARWLVDKLHAAGGKVCISDFSPSERMLAFVRDARVRLVKLKKDVSRKILEEKNYDEELKKIVAGLHECGAKVIAAQVNDTAALSGLWKADVDLVQGSLLPNLDAAEGGDGAADAYAYEQSARPLTRQA